MRSDEGFTLVEALVAGVLLVIGILGGVTVFDSSRHESATGERQQLASLRAQTELERVRDLAYADLAVDPAGSWPASGQPGDPVDRVTGGPPATFTVRPGQDEELAFAAVAGEGIAPHSTGTIAAGTGTLGIDIYRFVSWRDEECPITDLAGMTGPLQDTADPAFALIGGLLGPGGVLETLLGLVGVLNPIVDGRLDDAQELLVGLDSELDQLVAAIDGLNEVDPCDADVEALNEVDDTLGPLDPLLTELDSRINAYEDGCTQVLGVIVSCPGSASTLFQNLNQTLTNLENEDFETQIAGLSTSIGDLDSVDHQRNTKRVTVAVVLDERTGSGPSKPVWATSIVSDPDEGLLAGP